MEILRAHLSRVRIPEPSNRIYKQECCISFCTPVRMNRRVFLFDVVVDVDVVMMWCGFEFCPVLQLGVTVARSRNWCVPKLGLCWETGCHCHDYCDGCQTALSDQLIKRRGFLNSLLMYFVGPFLDNWGSVKFLQLKSILSHTWEPFDI